jgi:hypothetical protein
VDEALQCLHPGGLLLISEFTWTVYADDRTTALEAASGDDSEGSWLQRILSGTFYTVMRVRILMLLGSESRGAAINNGSDMREMAAVLQEGLGLSPLVDPAR